MPTALDNDGRRLLQLLIRMAPNIDVPNVGGFLTYLDAHKILGLRPIGRTYGDSLDNQGMGNVAGWAKSHGYPAITSLIISENPPMPAKGFFTSYGKDPMLDINWWLSEAAASKAFDWNRLKQERVINEKVGEQPVVIALADDGKSFFAFERPDAAAVFSLQNDTLFNGEKSWNLLGKAYDPANQDLKKITAYQEFWHSWMTFHPHTTRY